ncbi:MarR family winged helix-turn-helix transcriptional regulator [Flexivirga caeni]|uniref:MarR family transcriptional regulator n=1 Tax=Flexivirga caeni TaxID=2294115 RepID=A0A3M9M7W4_9MICO|nr:MarR family transcriptional regulator [Flexivirga caeni]RNI21307.1 MarR family transcriptional regulator [Flexivirga caeni]
MDRVHDSVDEHVARWAARWDGNPAFAPEVEGAITRMQLLLRVKNRRDTAAFLGEEDFTREDYETLHALMVQPYPTEATPTQLAESVRVTKASMTGRLARLERAGLITRETDSDNRRRVLVRPTQAGQDAWDHYVHEGMRREQDILRGLTDKELVQLNTLLRKAVRGLE